ncbi:MAG TPA: phosphopentomutase [Candidatus Fimiplasma intestinipullorum]|uniref:Phosphopentomutase n=1 Tax=Candidatus Fimiplasma intestinipullorum TaxID=2840825 RepID=A0A9D1HQE4_9FIRM|nr:phosphopentomutase [Candidatus Fimiplasma intestinipullorum]
MKKYKRVFLIVLDSLGIGESQDAWRFGDQGVNTLKHIAEHMEYFDVPNLEGLGLGSLGQFKGIYRLPANFATTAILKEVSNGKDTMTGHWEMMGLKVTEPFQTFTDTGFPDELIHALEERTGRHIVGNKAASGTEILDELGEHQIQTGDWIVYTSADSVLQIAAHEQYIGLDELYRACEIARELTMKEEWKVGRVIARPYIGEKKGEFKRTSHRHDYALKPFGKTVLNTLKDQNYDVISVGKINDIFCGEGITESHPSQSNEHGMQMTIEIAKERDFTGLTFVNLVDFDAVYGHRRNPVGYGKAIEAFDQQLGELMYALKEDDLLMITADHGNDPTYTGTDHTRENVPLLLYSKTLVKPHHLGELESFAVIGATIADNFEVDNPGIGTSLLGELM